jgi:hypothetical protein
MNHRAEGLRKNRFGRLWLSLAALLPCLAAVGLVLSFPEDDRREVSCRTGRIRVRTVRWVVLGEIPLQTRIEDTPVSKALEQVGLQGIASPEREWYSFADPGHHSDRRGPARLETDCRSGYVAGFISQVLAMESPSRQRLWLDRIFDPSSTVSIELVLAAGAGDPRPADQHYALAWWGKWQGQIEATYRVCQEVEAERSRPLNVSSAPTR